MPVFEVHNITTKQENIGGHAYFCLSSVKQTSMVRFRCPVKFTSKAILEINKIRSHKNIPDDYLLRVGLHENDREDNPFLLGFDLRTEEDILFKEDELLVIIRKIHITALNDKTVDFYEGDRESGFIFRDTSVNQ